MRQVVKGNHRLGHWATYNFNGYPRFTGGKYRFKYVHKVIFELVAGRPVREGFVIHHMSNRLCFCPHQLLECPPEFNPPGNISSRDPYTGRFIDRKEYERIYGISDNIPSWVTEESDAVA